MNVFNKYATAALVFGLLFCVSNKVKAQNLPLFSSYVYNEMLLSPSFAGSFKSSEQQARLLMVHRYQYSGFEGAPTTSLLSFDAPFLKQQMGLGAMVYTDKIGLIRQTGLQLAYSYQVSLSDKVLWNLGLAGNVGQLSLDMDAIRAKDENDNLINQQRPTKMFAHGGFGTHITSGGLMACLSVQNLGEQHLLSQNYRSNVATVSDNPTQYIAFASYDIDLKSDSFGITPILAFRYTQNVALQYDVILKAHLHHKFFITAGYRGGFGVSFGAGAVLANNLTLSYTYDHMTNEAGAFAGGGNEFTLGYRFFKNPRIPLATTQNPTTDLYRSYTQEEVDSLFDTQLEKLRNDLAELTKENQNQKSSIEGLHDKIDSLHSVTPDMRMEAEKVQVKEGFIANNIQFNAGSTVLTATSEKELDRIAAYLSVNPQVHLSISGHSDDSGRSEVNLLLSQKRALAVYNYLLNLGIASDRLDHAGYGSSKPIADNSTQQGREQNRRVELKVQ